MTEPERDTDETRSGLGGLFRPPLAAAVNHLLRSASWARAKLVPHAGKTARFDVAPFALALTIRDNGEVQDSPAAGAFDIGIELNAGTMLRVLGADESAWQEVQLDGDTELARDILYVAKNLRWDIEEDLSRVFGDIAAHRMVRAGNDLRRWHRDTFDQFARSAAAYWTEERPLLAARADIEQFVRDVDILRDDVARIEKRIDRFTR